MSTILNATKAVNKDLKDYLIEGAKVNYLNNGKDMVYTIEGVPDLEISTKGYIKDKGEIKYPKMSNDTVYIGARRDFKALNIAFKSLITYLNGYIPKGGLMLRLKDNDLGYAPNNIMMQNKFNGQEVPLDSLEKVGTPKVLSQQTLDIEDKIVLDPDSLYIKKASVIEYVTEDGAAFPTLDISNWHQENVTEAKALAQVVLDYNGGYILAEKVYQEKVKYNKARPYLNFRDVMDNDNGVVQRNSKEVVQFKALALTTYPKFAYLFSDKSYTIEQANEILEQLALAQDIFNNLEGLSKQNI